MTREEAIISIEEIKDFYGNKNKDGYALEFVALEKKEKEALDMAIEALQEQEHDGCEGCKYTDKDQYEMPCLMCKQSKRDLWEAKKCQMENGMQRGTTNGI